METKKKNLRDTMMKRLAALPPEKVQSNSAAIAESLRELPFYRNSRCRMFFVSFRNEVRTESLIRDSIDENRVVTVPYIIPGEQRMIASRIRDYDNDLAPGQFGILAPRREGIEPVDPAEIDFILVPGIAFDRCGGRLGLGGGFYDRFMQILNPRAYRVAVAHSLQITDECPMLPHDMRVHYVLTEKEIVKIKD